MYSTPSLYPGANRARFLTFGIVAASFALALPNAEVAQAQTPAGIAAAVDKTCAVMSGERKLDNQTLQLLLLLDEDLADPNPVSLALYRGVIHQCPKAYLAYEQRKRVNNPFAKFGTCERHADGAYFFRFEFL